MTCPPISRRLQSAGRRQLLDRRAERGTTLIEMMISLAVLLFIVGGTMTFLIYQARMSQGTFDRSDIQSGGRAALTLLSEKIGTAGLGIPRQYAIKSISDEACGDLQFPKLEVASLNFMREWTVQNTSGTSSSGTVTLASVDPQPGGTEDDVTLYKDAWVFLFQRASTSGHGMVQLGADRPKGTSELTGNTYYSEAQTSLDLSTSSDLNSSTSGNDTVMLVADVSAFGVDCTNDHPYLYWEYVDERGPHRDPIAANVHTEDVGLRFRFFIDQDGDGQPDTTVTKPIFNADPAVATNDDVVAIEVLVQLRSEKADPQLQAAGSDPYRSQDFVRVIRTPNINTRASQYIFIHNSGI